MYPASKEFKRFSNEISSSYFTLIRNIFENFPSQLNFRVYCSDFCYVLPAQR